MEQLCLRLLDVGGSITAPGPAFAAGCPVIVHGQRIAAIRKPT